ncbi:MAG: BON domain-containing protein [Gammaproteobacteria bacterium]|nr:BON domain-containing protein [Gammaproteobacteria bacterium]
MEINSSRKTRRVVTLAMAALLVTACDRSDRTPAERNDLGATPMNEAPVTAVPTPAPDNRVGDETLGERVDRAGEAMERQGDKIADAVDDAAITARVKAALVADPTLSALDINVDSKDGVVTLRGNVESPDASTRAGSLANDTEGVVSVDNRLVVAAVD